MIFLLDHCVWKETENILRKAGLSCVTLREIGRTEATNGEIIAFGKERKAILITRDRDFANLTLYPPGKHEGIIVLRITPKTINEVHAILLEVLRNIPSEQLSKSTIIITSSTYRIHRAK